MFLTCAPINRQNPSAWQALADRCDMHRNVMRLFAEAPNASSEVQILYRVLEERAQPYLYLMSSVQPALNEASWLFRGQNARQRDLTPLLARFAPGAAFGFDLLAYPCKKVYEGHRNSVRTFLHTPQERLDWLERQGERIGFSLSACHEDEAGDIRGKRKTGLVQFRAVRFTGALRVTDADKFRHGYACGIGPEKAYGLGMLLLRKG